ncbi:dihydrofolate reductase [Marinicauda algicola]|uniref:Dihydrofolate reductase n=1 Tax=Marinicauda algicola TaxID=2029849 RepID=A0A4S2GYL7_9PROT|nr:dihydrofolate reductase [Marinicauda algicola]TGY88265.1 dihydrofolate reductase [Marinicauda algicola]
MSRAVKLVHVVARGRNGVIGREGDLPWKLRSDLKRFRQITMGKPVVMGRRTWESLPRKPLPGRPNIVVSTTLADAEGAEVFDDPWHALEAARAAAIQAGVDEVCIIGGAQLYALTLERADRLYLTEVDLAPQGSAVYPDIDESAWREVHRERHEPGEGDDAAFTLRVLDRMR